MSLRNLGLVSVCTTIGTVLHKKAAVFLATIGPNAFHNLRNLVAPRQPGEETYVRLIEVMSEFYNHKPLVTMQRYRFYSRFRQSDESVSAFVAEL